MPLTRSGGMAAIIIREGSQTRADHRSRNVNPSEAFALA